MTKEFERRIGQAKIEARIKAKEEKERLKIAQKKAEEEKKDLLRGQEQIRAKKEESIQYLTGLLREPLIQIGARDLLVECKKRFRNGGRFNRYMGPYETFSENLYHHNLLEVIERMQLGKINISSDIKEIGNDGVDYNHTQGRHYPKGYTSRIAAFSMALKGKSWVEVPYSPDYSDDENPHGYETPHYVRLAEINRGINTRLYGDRDNPLNVIFVMECNGLWHTFLPGYELPKTAIDGVKGALVDMFVGGDKRYQK